MVDESKVSVSQFLDALDSACDLKSVDEEEGLSKEEWLQILQLIGMILA